MPVVSIEMPPGGFELNERQQRLLEIVRARGFATIEQLSEIFAVSAQTVRRDVIRLDAAGLLQRFHGGAGLPAGLPDDIVRLGYRQKQGVAAGPKASIGRAAAGLIPDGASVYLDVGTTVEAVAAALLDRSLGAVYTNSMSTGAVLGQSRQAEVYVTGGLVRGGDGSLVGDAASKALGALAVDFAIVGCSGFGPDGSPMDFDPQKVAIKQAALDRARAAIIVADCSKFGRMAMVEIAPLARFGVLVCDRPPGAAFNGQLRAAGVEVHVAA